MMKYVVKHIAKSFIELDRNGLTIELNPKIFDPFISVGDEVDIEINIEYKFSRENRNDISNHHKEEALVGNL